MSINQDALILKYRPETFDEVIGQAAVCKSVSAALKKHRGHAFLFSGPSGVGKTSIGRIIAREVECEPIDLIEVDGASTTGIDAMRDLLSHLQYASPGPRVIIVDEVHAVSSQAVKSLLKSLEEPASNVYWVLCTTELSKVPREIRTRCLDYTLKPVPRKGLLGLVIRVAKEEQMKIRRSLESLAVIAELADGSPRQALSILAQCSDLTDEEEVRSLCAGVEPASKEAVDLCRLLLKGGNWQQLSACIAKIDTPPESVRIIVLRYMAATIIKTKSPQRVLAVMEEFSQPFLDREGKAPILLACGRLSLG